MDTITYTTAPKSFDGNGTRTLRTIGVTDLGTPVRMVCTPARYVRWQRQQYWNGIVYMTADEAEWQRQLAAGVVFEIEEELRAA